MITPIPAAHQTVSDMLWHHLMPVLLAFAAGVASMQIVGDARQDQVVDDLLAEVRHARDDAAWSQTLAARYAQACGRAAPPVAPEPQARRAPALAGPLPVTCRATGAGQ